MLSLARRLLVIAFVGEGASFGVAAGPVPPCSAADIAAGTCVVVNVTVDESTCAVSADPKALAVDSSKTHTIKWTSTTPGWLFGDSVSRPRRWGQAFKEPDGSFPPPNGRQFPVYKSWGADDDFADQMYGGTELSRPLNRRFSGTMQFGYYLRLFKPGSPDKVCTDGGPFYVNRD